MMFLKFDLFVFGRDKIKKLNKVVQYEIPCSRYAASVDSGICDVCLKNEPRLYDMMREKVYRPFGPWVITWIT